MNTQTQHSPAPWSLRGDILRDANGVLLYRLTPLDEITIAQDDANRRLIEVAPEMASVLAQLAGLARREIERPLNQRTGFAQFERNALSLLAKLSP